jgi:acetyltransferase-like isoleucine patch superfamily enzyme/coenzyme F420-reducing hydrogenase beta subunit
MINIINKEDCCGCKACGDVCTKGAISFKIDIEGFWYPEVDNILCINCGACNKVCPIENIIQLKKNDLEKSECYAAEHKNLEVVFDSTSGGLFSALADVMYRRNGYVGGALFNKDFSISQYISNSKDDLPKLRSSKYLQSDSEGFYKEVKKLCASGENILVCGTPCQMSALRAYLGKDYDNLIIADFICRGVNSPKIWRKYLDSFEERYGSPVVYAKAKSKEYGWRNLTQKVALANGKSYYETYKNSLWTQGYLATNVYCRPSCYSCHFKDFPRMADITLADFWGIEKYNKTMDKNLGTSLVMLNSRKGQKYFEEVKSRINFIPMPFDSILGGNLALKQPLDPPLVNRTEFFEYAETHTFTELAQKYIYVDRVSLKKMIKKILRLVYHAIFFKHCFNASFFKTICVNRRCHGNYIHLIKGNGIIIDSHTLVKISKNADLSIKGILRLGAKRMKGSSWETRFLVEGDGKVRVDSDCVIGYGSDIEVFDHAELHIKGRSDGVQEVPGSNCNTTIICGNKIEIGNDVMIGRNVIIRDSNGGHYMNLPGYKASRPVIIGDKVWLCESCVIMPGVKIGEGAIVGAGSVVFTNVPAHSLVSGNPAKVVEENVLWKY